jgi:hypothetical protein
MTGRNSPDSIKSLKSLIIAWFCRGKPNRTDLPGSNGVTSARNCVWSRRASRQPGILFLARRGYFLVQTYETVFGDQLAQKGVNYWMYDSERKRFRIIFFSNNGPYSEQGNQYAGEVKRPSFRAALMWAASRA